MYGRHDPRAHSPGYADEPGVNTPIHTYALAEPYISHGAADTDSRRQVHATGQAIRPRHALRTARRSHGGPDRAHVSRLRS
jgi:hypothetical protein